MGQTRLPIVGLAGLLALGPQFAIGSQALRHDRQTRYPTLMSRHARFRAQQDGLDVSRSTSTVPLPPPRPDNFGSPHPGAATTLLPRHPKAVQAELPSDPLRGDPDEARNAECLNRLERLGVKADPIPAIVEGACGASRLVRVTAVGASVAVIPPATVVCAMAETLARWTKDVVSAQGNELLGSSPSRILIGTSYQCRGQNRQAGAKLSEHAFANAVDVMGFGFARRPDLTIGFQPDTTAEGRFQAAIRNGACAYFTTVLGPGTDAEHANHLHLDLRQRRGGMKICQ